MPKAAPVTTPMSHGGTLTFGSPNVFINGLAVVRLGDIYICPIHGPNPTVQSSATVKANGLGVYRVGDATFCGASPDPPANNVIVGN